jgi:phenylacetate-CoA ligase
MTADFEPLHELEARRRALWPEQAAYLSQASLFYQKLWNGRPPPHTLSDIADLPLADKAMLRRSQADHPPFGDYLAAPLSQISRIHRTGGTTGQGMNLALGRDDARQTAEIGGRAQRAAGLGPEHRVVHCLNYQLWMGGFTDHTTLEETGAAVVPFGVGGSRKLIQTIRELGITAISCTPSYPAVLEQVIAEHFPDIAPRDLGLKLGLFGGEPGLDDPAFRHRMEETWGFKAMNANYGVSDVFCNFAAQCGHQTDLHFVALDVLHPELIDPDTARPVPWEAGRRGELVLTHMARRCQPLARFRTGDIIDLTATEPCACGRTAPRFRVVGRSDDMVVVRGINVFPTNVAAVINAVPGLSGEYRIVLTGPGPYDTLPVEAELTDEGAARPDTGAALATAIKRDLGVTAAITLAAPRSLPRTEGKTRRVIRKDRT